MSSAALQARLDSVVGDAGLDPVDARAALGQIVDDADRHGDGELAARGRYALARALVTLGRPSDALELIDASERGFRANGAVAEALRTNLGRMHVLDDLGRHEEAAQVGRLVATELSALDDESDDAEITWLRAAVEENTGVALGYLGRHTEALAAYSSAAECYRRLGTDEDSARVLLNRGVELCELARTNEAVPALSEARVFFAADGDRMNEALCLTNLSEAWTAAGRYLDAFDCLDAAGTVLRGLNDTTDWARAELARADCLVTLNLDVEALDLYDDLVEPLEAAGLRRDLAKVHLGRGTVLARTGSVAPAMQAFDAARELFGATGDNTLLARTCLAAAELEDDPGDSIETALTLLSDGERPAEFALALLASARHRQTTDQQRAGDDLRQAADLIGALGVPDLTWQLHHLLGMTLRRAGDRDGALAELRSAVGALDEIRATLDGDGRRLHFDGARRAASDDLVDLLLDAGDVGAAIALVDTLHGRGLAEAMEGGTRNVEAITTHGELRSTYDRLLTARGPLVGDLTSRARHLESEVMRTGAIATARPGVPIDRVELPSDTVCYRILRGEVVAFVGGGTAPLVERKVCELSRVEQLLGRLLVQWRRFEHPAVIARHEERVYEATVDVLRDLHTCLIAPIDDHLPIVETLTVIADGPIGAVPFAALHQGGEFLIERFAVRQTPSIAVDRLLGSKVRGARSVLAVGTSDEFAPMAAVEATLVGEAWSELSRESVVLRSDEAVADDFLELAPEHDVLHVAGHGLFREDAQEFSAIRFADRWLTAAEFARLRLDGQLVVLSACDSGSRHAGRLREVTGLPRALLAAGARGVVASLWPADDAATTQQMSSLHRELAGGATSAAALRSAQRSTQVSHPHPYHWASTILIGGAT